MRFIGFAFIIVGISILLFALYSYFRGPDALVSPVPDSKGVRVIYLTPGAAENGAEEKKK
jgi:hypothetical protein